MNHIFIPDSISGTQGVRLTRMDVPSAVVVGDSIWLNCSYDLEEDQLYSIKWYKNNYEFYRFLENGPNDEPTTKEYQLPGINLDVRYKSSKF